MSISDFTDVYAAARRGIELKMLEYLFAKLAPSSRAFYMVTLITKQDLWWKQKDEAKQHYTEGDYNKQIEPLRERLGEMNFHHEYVPTSLTIANLTTPTAEKLALTAQGYDQEIHLQ